MNVGTYVRSRVRSVFTLTPVSGNVCTWATSAQMVAIFIGTFTANGRVVESASADENRNRGEIWRCFASETLPEVPGGQLDVSCEL